MSAFIRLQDGDATDVERLLLESGAQDVPSSGARARTLLAVGAAAGATMVTSAAGHGAASALVAAGGSSAKTAGSMTALVLAKWLGTGALLGAVTAACIATATTPGLRGPSKDEPSVSAAAPAVPESPRAVARATTPVAVPNAEAPPAVESATNPTGTRAATSEAVAPAGRSLAPETTQTVPAGGGSGLGASVPPAPSANGSSVLAEVASLDRARAALGSGDARTALARLAEHEQNFSGGALEPEAVVLEVRAMVQLGQRTEATALVNRFLAAHPNSSQNARLRGLVGTTPR